MAETAEDKTESAAEVEVTMATESQVKGGEQRFTAELTEELKETGSSMLALVRRIVLAGAGAVGLTMDEIEEFVARLVERGEIAEQDGRRLIKDVVARRRSEAESVGAKAGETAAKVQEETEKQASKIESTLDQRIEAVLSRLNMPTKSDINMLSEKISMLAEKVEALKNS